MTWKPRMSIITKAKMSAPKRKPILEAALKALLAAVETPVVVKGTATFVAELSSRINGLSDDQRAVLDQASNDELRAALLQLDMATKNAAFAAAGTKRIEDLLDPILKAINSSLQRLHDRLGNGTRQLLLFKLGGLVEHTDVFLRVARIECTEPLRLASELEDSHEATRLLWEAERKTSDLTPRELEDVCRLAQITLPPNSNPIDFALIASADPLYRNWSDILSLTERLSLPKTFEAELDFARAKSFLVLRQIVRGVYAAAIGTSEHVEVPQSYGLDSTYKRLCVHIGNRYDVLGASAFFTGVASSRLWGCIKCALDLSRLVGAAPPADVIDKLKREAREAYRSMTEHAEALGFDAKLAGLNNLESGSPSLNSQWDQATLERLESMVTDWTAHLEKLASKTPTD